MAFLFGAGVSKPAGLPVAADITEVLLRGENVFRHTSERYLMGVHPNPQIDPTRDYLERILLLLGVLKTEADIYYFGDKKPNYEDLYFMAQQLLGSVTFEEDNPVAHRFNQFLNDRFKSLLETDPHAEAVSERSYPPAQKIGYRHGVATLPQLLRESCNYMRDIACAMIGRQPLSTEYLGWLVEAVRDHAVGQKVFFALNYDTILEDLLQSRSIPFVDGFAAPDESKGVCHFDPACFERAASPQVIKLHGSLKWFTNRPSRQQPPAPLKFIKVSDADTAQKHFEMDVPIVLVGTHNKPSYYSNPLFEDLHNRFFNILRTTPRIVVCGYSFGDKAVNTRLLYWLDQDRERRMIVIHPDAAGCRRGARPAVSRAWDELEKRGQITFIQRGAEKVTWPEVMNVLT